jgi:hypothetical protein
VAAAHSPPEGEVQFTRRDACGVAARTGPASGRTAPRRLGCGPGRLDIEDNEEDGGMLVDPDIGASAMVSFAQSIGVAG